MYNFAVHGKPSQIDCRTHAPGILEQESCCEWLWFFTFIEKSHGWSQFVRCLVE